LLQEQLKLESDIEKIRNGGTKPKENNKKVGTAKTEEESKKLRAALNSIADTEFEIRFNFSDASQQVDMLNQKIQDVFSQQSGKYANVDAFVNADRHKMNEQEIKDLEKIIELEGRRAEIEKHSAEEYDRELESYTEILNQRFKQQQDKRLEKEISEAEKNGESEQARAIMERELASARKAAQQMEREYLSALEMAQEDDAYTAEERKRVEDLKRKWQESLSDQDKWQSRIDMSNDKQEKKVIDTVGSFSLKVLASQLGGDKKPEIETARNTKRMKELLEQINGTNGRVWE
jgi:chromosome segregation ATPase